MHHTGIEIHEKCNSFKSGKEIAYGKGLLAHYGQDILNKILENKRNYQVLKLRIPELKEALKIARLIKKNYWLEKILQEKN